MTLEETIKKYKNIINEKPIDYFCISQINQKIERENAKRMIEWLEDYKTLSEKQHNISDEKLSQLETSIINHIRESGVLTKEEIVNIVKFEIERVRYE